MDIRNAIQKINAEFAELYELRDATGIAAAYVENGAILAPNRNTHHGRLALEDFWRGFFDEIGGTARIEPVEIAGAGDLAYQWATYFLEGGAEPDAGKFVEIYKRQADGSWKIRLTIFNSDNPA
jgi:ketosteroid isomerase-like protein